MLWNPKLQVTYSVYNHFNIHSITKILPNNIFFYVLFKEDFRFLILQVFYTTVAFNAITVKLKLRACNNPKAVCRVNNNVIFWQRIIFKHSLYKTDP